MLVIQPTVWKFLINYGIGLRRGRDNCFNRLEYLKNHEQEGGPWNVTTEENDLGSPRIWRGMSQKALLGHRTEHIRDKPYGRHQCGRCLVNPEISKSIQEYTPVKSLFPCDLCDKSFSRSEVLQRHKRRHTRVKPFQCQYREKPFSRADVLQLHSRAHTGEMPFVCRQCGIVLSRSGYLKSHLITHPWKKPKCSYCEKCFAWKPSLTSHERSHPRKQQLCNEVLGNFNGSWRRNTLVMFMTPVCFFRPVYFSRNLMRYQWHLVSPLGKQPKRNWPYNWSTIRIVLIKSQT